MNDTQAGGGPAARGWRQDHVLLSGSLLGLLSGQEQVWRGGSHPGIGHRAARAEEKAAGLGAGGTRTGRSHLKPRLRRL